ncbi:MAG: hypothetical protein EXR62_04210 [Chloroflexi bacterium]|nr:hypothetical protein [Chloroflexota bacterium]
MTRQILKFLIAAFSLLLIASIPFSHAIPAGYAHPLDIAAQGGFTSPDPVASTPADSRRPTLTTTADGTPHVAWEESGQILHAFRGQSGWSTPVVVTLGSNPALASAGSTVYLVWADIFGDNLEIFISQWSTASGAWSLSRNVSNTSGNSTTPTIAVSQDGKLFVAWADNTSGVTTTYVAQSDDGGVTWPNSGPIPGGDGLSPAIAIGQDGLVHVVWQSLDNTSNTFDIWHSQQQAALWSAAENISASPGIDSIKPWIAIAPDNRVHTVWEEDSATSSIAYSGGSSLAWSVPVTISQSGNNANLPRIATDDQGSLHVTWRNATSLAIEYRQWFPSSGSWAAIATPPPATNAAGVARPALAAEAGGRIHLAWEQPSASANADVYTTSVATRCSPLVGDVNCTCTVLANDLTILSSHWHSQTGNAAYSLVYDLDDNGQVDLRDIMQAAAHWGDACLISP